MSSHSERVCITSGKVGETSRLVAVNFRAFTARVARDNAPEHERLKREAIRTRCGVTGFGGRHRISGPAEFTSHFHRKVNRSTHCYSDRVEYSRPYKDASRLPLALHSGPPACLPSAYLQLRLRLRRMWKLGTCRTIRFRRYLFQVRRITSR